MVPQGLREIGGLGTSGGVDPCGPGEDVCLVAQGGEPCVSRDMGIWIPKEGILQGLEEMKELRDRGGGRGWVPKEQDPEWLGAGCQGRGTLGE